MKRAATLLVGAFGLAGAAWAQASPEELAVLAKTEQWTFWMMWTGIASVVAAAVGVAALFWTFVEQRKLTQSQERAILTIVAGRVVAEGDVIDVYLAVKNTGRTHAFRVESIAAFHTADEYIDAVHVPGEVVLRPVRERMRRLNPLQATHRHIAKMLPGIPPGDTEVAQHHFQKLPPEIDEAIRKDAFGQSLYVVVRYHDVFGRRQSLALDTMVALNQAMSAELEIGEAGHGARMFDNYARR